MNNFNDYMAEIRASERLKKTLELFKKGNLTIEEAIEFIATDVQFHKKDLEDKTYKDINKNWIYYPGTSMGSGSGTIYTTGSTTTNPYTVSGSLSGPDNSTP